MGKSLGRAPLGGSETEAWTVDGWETVGNSLGRGLLGGSDILRSRAVGTGFQDKFHQRDCSEKLCAQRLLKRCLNAGKGTCRKCMGKRSLLEGFSFCTAFCPSMLEFCLVCFAARGYASAGNSLRRALLGGSGTENAELLARVLHRAAFTQRSFPRRIFYTEKLVHRKDFTHSLFCTEKLLHRQERFLHTEAFTQRSLYTE